MKTLLKWFWYPKLPQLQFNTEQLEDRGVPMYYYLDNFRPLARFEHGAMMKKDAIRLSLSLYKI